MVQKSLLALAMGGLAIGMTEFTMMGVLEDFANDLNISIPTAGNFISMYAMGVMVGAPTLIMATSKYSPKKVLIFFMLLFTIFNALFVVAPSYNTLMIARFMSGLPHGAFFWCWVCCCSAISHKRQRSTSNIYHVCRTYIR